MKRRGVVEGVRYCKGQDEEEGVVEGVRYCKGQDEEED